MHTTIYSFEVNRNFSAESRKLNILETRGEIDVNPLKQRGKNNKLI